PPRQQLPGRTDVGHDVDVPRARPRLLRGLRAAVFGDPGVAAVEVDVAEFLPGAAHEGAHAVLARRVSGDGDRAQFPRDRLDRRTVEVGQDEPGTLGGERTCEGGTDAAARPGDDDAGAVQVHGHSPPPRVTPPSSSSVWPVIHPAASDSRKVTAPAMSSGT